MTNSSSSRPRRPVLSLMALGVHLNPRLDIASEVAQLLAELQSGPGRRRLRVTTAWAPRLQDLQGHLLRERPSIVHMATHGETDGSLRVISQSGQIVVIPTSALVGLMSNFPTIRLVVLNACHSAGAAEELADTVGAAIGMDGAICDAAAVAFAVGFYRALGFGCTVDRAHRLGCNAIALEGFASATVPRLFTAPQSALDWSP